MLATGTGIAPFVSIAQDRETYSRSKRVYLFSTVRTVDEITYEEKLNSIAEHMSFVYVVL